MLNQSTFVYPGGIRNMYTKVSFAGGSYISKNMLNITDQEVAPHTVVERICPLPPDSRAEQDPENDI